MILTVSVREGSKEYLNPSAVSSGTLLHSITDGFSCHSTATVGSAKGKYAPALPTLMPLSSESLGACGRERAGYSADNEPSSFRSAPRNRVQPWGRPVVDRTCCHEPVGQQRCPQAAT